MNQPLIDNFGRRIDYLRLAVTDRCNLRCRYCMPAQGIPKAPQDEILTWEELERLCRVMISLGVCKVRITGGEPLLRQGLIPFLGRLGCLPSAPEIGITTNATLLSRHLHGLRRAGVRRLNISLDSLREATFDYIARRPGLGPTLHALNRADRLGFDIKINMVVLAGVNDHEIPDFVQLTRERRWTVRFIEAMPFNGAGGQFGAMLNGDDILSVLQRRFILDPVANDEAAVDVCYRVPGYRGKVGIIYGFSRRFCQGCSRIRISARGELRTCLYGTPVLDARALLRDGSGDSEIMQALQDAVNQRSRDGFESERAGQSKFHHSMATIGG
ncbi:MAG: GTP 3',8-cyclase MoaA [Candidatus Neomarinimicrobiota bacterium]